MALIKCSECGKEVSENAASCPNCGNPMNPQPQQVQQPQQKELENGSNDSVCGLEYGKKEPEHISNVAPTDSPIEDRYTSVHLMDYPKKEILLFCLLAPLFGFLMYDAWPMVVCVFISSVIQVLCAIPFCASLGHGVRSNIKVSEIDQYVVSENKKRNILKSVYVIIAVLNCFPFISTNSVFMHSIGKNAYEGGVIVTIITLAIIAFWGLFMLPGIPKPGVEINQKLKEQGLTIEDKQRMEEIKKQEIEQLKIKKYGEGYIRLAYDIIVNDNIKKLFIGEKEYDFKDILDFTVKDNAVTIHSASTSKAKTNTGSMVGRAVVGQVLFGNVGAVIGGATASKTIEHSESKSTVKHDYSIIITVNNIASPTEIIKCGRNDAALNKIVSTLTVILKSNN